MKKNYLILIILIFSSGIFNKSHAYFLSGWITYDQQFGAIDKSFITFGGANTGISISGGSLGLAIYGNYPFKWSPTSESVQIYYGGATIGYNQRGDILGIRTLLLLGAGSISSIPNTKSFHFVVSPSLYIDFMIFKRLALTLGITYRYFEGASNTQPFNINAIQNSLLASVSLGWIF